MKSTHTHIAHLDIPTLYQNSTYTHMLPHLASERQLSIRQHCDTWYTDYCTIKQIRHNFKSQNHHTGIRQGIQTIFHWLLKNSNPCTKLCDRRTYNSTMNKFCTTISICPFLDTLTKAIQVGYLPTFPHFITKQLRLHSPPRDETFKWKMPTQISNLRFYQKLYMKPYLAKTATNTTTTKESTSSSPQSNQQVKINTFTVSIQQYAASNTYQSIW